MLRSRFLPSARFVFRPDDPRPDSVQAELEARFFRGLHLPNGTYKTTARGRMKEVDAVFRKVVKPPQGPLKLLDVAVSSGVTTLDWLNSLDEAGINATITASDLCLFAYLERRAGLDLLTDSDGQLLQIARGRIGVCRPYRGRNRRLPRLTGLIYSSAERLVRRLPVERVERIPLVVAGVLTAPAIELTEADIARPPRHWKGRFDAIRAANILHREYFADAELTFLIGSLIECLGPHGTLVIGRTQEEGENHFSFLRRGQDGALRVIERIGGGADIESLLDGFQPAGTKGYGREPSRAH